MIAAVLCVLAAAGEVSVVIAPDQPIPHVYMDEPLVAEFRSEGDITVHVVLELDRDHGERVTHDLGELRLRAKQPLWRELTEVPPLRDRYRARFVLKGVDGSTAVMQPFCRIDRPLANVAGPLALSTSSFGRDDLLALRAVPMHTVRIEADLRDVAKVGADLQNAGLGLIVGITTENLGDPVSLATRLATAFRDSVIRWEIDAGADAELLEEVAKALRNGGSRSPIALVARETGTLGSLLREGAGRYASRCVYRHDSPTRTEIRRFRGVLMQSGYERMPLYVLGRGVDPGEDKVGARLLRQVVLNAAVDIEQTTLDAALVFENRRFAEGYNYISGMAHRLNRTTYVGELAFAAPVYAQVFRRGQEWVVVAWTAEAARDIEMTVGDAEKLSLVDSLNNPLSLGPVNDGVLTLAIGSDPVYLGGKGGRVMAEAAGRLARRHAQALVDDKQNAERIPEDLFGAIKRIAGSKEGRPDRRDLFALLGMFPYVEREWHAGVLPRAVAVTTLAEVSRIALLAATLEEEIGEPFIERTEDALTRCSDYQSQYLTGLGGAASATERGDWLLQEIARLVARANELDDHDRHTEAYAVASIAEWRARALEFAANALPLSEPDPVAAKLRTEELKEERKKR
jgi:hypothetical protein